MLAKNTKGHLGGTPAGGDADEEFRALISSSLPGSYTGGSGGALDLGAEPVDRDAELRLASSEGEDLRRHEHPPLEVTRTGLENSAGVARAVAFRLKGPAIRRAITAEMSSSKEAWCDVLASINRLFNADHSLQVNVARYLTAIPAVEQSRALGVVSRDSSGQRQVTDERSKGISDYCHPEVFNEFFKIPGEILDGLRQTAHQAAEMVLGHEAMKLRISAYGQADALAPHLVQLLLSVNSVWRYCYAHPHALSKAHAHAEEECSAGAVKSIQSGAPTLALCSLGYFWSCHFMHRLCSLIDVPDLAKGIADELEAVTINPHYFKKQEWLKSHDAIQTLLGEFSTTLVTAKALAAILRWQVHGADFFQTLEKDLQHYAEESEPFNAAIPDGTLETLPPGLAQSPLRLDRFSEHSDEVVVYRMRPSNDLGWDVFTLSVFTKSPDLQGMREAQAFFIPTKYHDEADVYGFLGPPTLPISQQDSPIFTGDYESSCDVPSAVRKMCQQFRRDLAFLRTVASPLIERCSELPGPVAIELRDDGCEVVFASEQAPEMVKFFDGLPEVQESLRNSPCEPGTVKILDFQYRIQGPNRAGGDGVDGEPDGTDVVEVSQSDQILRREVSKLLRRHSFKFWEFRGFVMKNWDIDIEPAKGSHKKFTLDGSIFPFGKLMRDPDEKLKPPIALKMFAALKIPLSDVAERLRT
jgi:hypothetical protein